MKPILISSDHAGFELKEVLKDELKNLSVDFRDIGAGSSEVSVDYPLKAGELAGKIESGSYEKGVLICGSGIGMSLTANSFRGVRAALCANPEAASLSRKHNNSNVLVLGGRVTSPELGREILRVWLATEFEGGRHERRVNELERIKERSHLHGTDEEIYKVIKDEEDRQNDFLEMIASENFASRAVMEASGSVLTNKYAEGYPHKRYYGGCQYVDRAEELAIERARKLFGAEFVNVQPHSGSQANMAVYYALLKPGDVIMGLDLSHGGHLTHGSRVNFSGKIYNVISYKVSREDQTIDYDELRRLAKEHKPKLIVTGASAYPRVIRFDKFREICDEVGAYLMADIAHIAGLVVAGLHPSPMEYAHAVTTTTHKTLRGPRGGMIMTNNDKLAKAFNGNIFPGIQGGPLMHTIAAKAVAFKEALDPSFNVYQQQIVKNAKALADGLLSRGFDLVSGGTDTHLLLIDLRSKGIKGTDAEKALDYAGITVNKNTIPYDPEKPSVASGIRLGTPALTTRGMKEGEMFLIAELIDNILGNMEDEKTHLQVRDKVKSLCEKFPLWQ